MYLSCIYEFYMYSLYSLYLIPNTSVLLICVNKPNSDFSRKRIDSSGGPQCMMRQWIHTSVDSGYLVFIYRWLATQIIVSFHPEHCLGKIFPILMDTPIFAIFRWCSKPPPVPVMDLEHRLKL